MRPGSPMANAGSAGSRLHEFQPFLVGAQRDRLHRIREQPRQMERNAFDMHLAGFDLRKIEDVVDDREQRLGRRLDDLQVLTGSSSSRVPSASSVMPMTPFIGVRISWLMLARKSDFARLAASAASIARISAASASCAR